MEGGKMEMKMKVKTEMEKKVETAVTEALKDDARGPMFVLKKLDCEQTAVEEIPNSNMSLMCPMSREAELIRALDVKFAFDKEAVKKAVEIAKEKGAEFVIKALQLEDKM
jgi:L-lactate utilization protein LutC